MSNKISSLSTKLFDDKELSLDEEEMLLFISSSGTYGTLEHRVNKGVGEKGKFRYLMSRIFPPMASYKINYPWAYKHKIFVPIAWFLRLCRGLFKQHGQTKNELRLINKHKNEDEND